MNYNVPQRYETQIQEVAQAQHISDSEVQDRIFKAGLERFVPSLTANPQSDLDKAVADAKAEHPTYASFFGAVKGRPGADGSKEAVDRYIAELRNEW